MIQVAPRPNGAHAPAPETLDAIHAPVLEGFAALVDELGGDAAALMRQVGLAPAAATEGGGKAGYRQVAQLLELAAAELARPDFGLLLASRQCRGILFGPLGEAMRNARSFGEALETVARHSYAHSLAAGIWLKPSPSADGVMLGHDILLDRLPGKRQLIEQILLIGHLTAINLTAGLVRARRIDFRHQPVSPAATYRRHFGCEVRFGQQVNATLYHERDLARPIVAADEQAFRSAMSAIEARFAQREAPLRVRVRGVISQTLGSDLCTTEQVADELGVHPRTLHRRLRDEGTSFRGVRDEIRRELLSYYLTQTDLELTSISERLGFSEQSVLTRCCRRWFSMSPTELRGRVREKPADL